MYKSLKKRRIILILSCLGVLLATFILVVGKTNEKEFFFNDEQKEIMTQVEQSQDLSLRVVENSDTPLRITQTKVKQISAPHFSVLTGKRANFDFLSSVPEVRLINVSQIPITNFVLVLRNPKTKTTRMLMQGKISIPPGATYIIKRQDFVRPEFLRNKNVPFELGMNSNKFWIEFAPVQDIFVTIGQVGFANGQNWLISEGGEIQ